ncbi:MAG: exodeoxyribonuclease V subunit gamma [Solirubrobacterales bacterium]|nr:exodeoxyribonuclease V subunit gamma [Solirubrobacterales bacterium]
MPLTLVLGPANSAKAGEVLGAYAAAAARGAVLVVPTALDARHYARELAGGGAVLGSVRTFSGLMAEIAGRAGYEERRLTALQRERVLRAVIAQAPLQALAQAAQFPGFVLATGDLIAELQRSLLTPQRVTQGLATWAAEDPRREPFARDLTALYSGYAAALERLGRVDQELYAWRALDALRDAPGSWGREQVFFYGFDDLTPLERDAVETLARIADAAVTVSLTYEPGRAALSARAEAVEELRQLAERVQELPALADHYAPRSRQVLHHLERELFSDDHVERVEPGDAVRLLEAGGERAEAELVAAEVLALLRAGVPGDEIVIVFRSLSASAPLIASVFAEYGIELAGERCVQFSQTALGGAVLALARCALLEESSARAEDLLGYLRSPGLLERTEVADGLELEIRREGLRTAAQARARLGWELDELDSLRAAADPGRELARQARRLFMLPYRGQACQLEGSEALDASALATLVRALGELEEVGEQLTAEELIELLERLEVDAGAPPRPGVVLVAEPLAIRARRFRCVFICGLQEGKFPLPGSPEPFLSDQRRRELAAGAGLRLAPREDALARERYLFYACVSRATEQLVLSYRSSDEEGNLELPSPFIADVGELLAEGWVERRRRRLLADVVWPAHNVPTAHELARAHAAAAAPRAGVLGAPSRSLGQAALTRVRHRRILSGGALEAYADCPVKWLVERELAPASLEPDPEPLARGNFMHAALEELLRRLDGPITGESLPDAFRLLEEVLAESPAPIGAGRPESLRAAAVKMIEADLRRYLAHEADDGCAWAPEGIELRFGFEDEQESLPALSLGEGQQQIRLRGVIDRVDVAPDHSGRAIVRDYKSGSARPEHQGAHWRADRQLQVALYMLAVRELLDLDPVAGLYQPLGGADLRARGVFLEGADVGARVVAGDARPREDLDGELVDAAARAIALAGRLRAGELVPTPETCSRDGCRFPGICRVE